jgi:hypothetical protein
MKKLFTFLNVIDKKKSQFLFLTFLLFLLYVDGLAQKSQSINIFNEKYKSDFVTLPSYDINNLPISVWFFTDGDDKVGFLIAGHAYKEVCEVASQEIMDEIEKMGRVDTTIFTYGVGFDIRPKTSSRWNKRYDSLLTVMERNFIELEDKNPDQVEHHKLLYEDYKKIHDLIKNHITWANSDKVYDNHIVEYQHTDTPIIVPFYDIKTQQPIVFNVPKESFGTIPTDLVKYDIIKNITTEITLINEANKHNNNQLIKVKNISNNSLLNTYILEGYSLFAGKIEEIPKFLYGYSPPPDNWYLQRTVNGKVVSQERILPQEALAKLKSGEIYDPESKKELEDWLNQVKKDNESFEVRKKSSLAELQKQIKFNNSIIQRLSTFKTSILNTQKDNHIIIDAFLRGWAFNTGDEKTNERLDKWYDDYRPKIWAKIFEKYPNAKVDDKMAGIFHSDDVFFDVKLKGNIFKITPYKVIGGEFVQVIDKNVGISTFYTSFNFRHQ